MRTDVLISGGGILGSFISLKLSEVGLESIILEKNKPNLAIDTNIRTITLNSNSVKILDDAGIKTPSAEITTMKVFDGEGSGNISFKADEIGQPFLSKVVLFNDLKNELHKKTSQYFRYEKMIDSYEDNKNIVNSKLNTKENIESKLIIGCEGRESNLSKLADIKSNFKKYNQIAYTFLIENKELNRATAYQFFSEKGIFAVMPYPDNANDKYTIVWSIHENKLKDDSKFFQNNFNFFEKKIGTELKIISEVINFKLSSHHLENYFKDKIVLVGDSAHSIHPLAGQGINLGFSDANILCEEIKNAHNCKYPLSHYSILKSYEARRKSANKIMMSSIDGLNNIFETDNLYIRLLRNYGLNFVDKSHALKSFFMRQASGE